MIIIIRTRVTVSIGFNNQCHLVSMDFTKIFIQQKGPLYLIYQFIKTYHNIVLSYLYSFNFNEKKRLIIPEYLEYNFILAIGRLKRQNQVFFGILSKYLISSIMRMFERSKFVHLKRNFIVQLQ